MFSKSSHRITFAKHVYLRTQQRRLRHVKSIVVRNLSSGLEYEGDPLNRQVHFTVHPLYDADKVLYRSETISRTCNPSWESITAAFGKHSSLSMFTIKIWVRGDSRMSSPSHEGAGSAEEEPEGDSKLVFEKTLDLCDLVYLGTLVNKDGSCYPTNSVVIGMFEGYYGDPVVDGVPAAIPISHSLVDLLPPCSLLEVTKTEVVESYLSHTLQRILSRQELLNNATVGGNNSKVKVQQYMREQEDYFRKKREKENLKMRIDLLQREIQQREKLEKEESERLSKQRAELDSFESSLRNRQSELRKTKSQYQLSQQYHSQRVDMLACARKNRTLRQRNMVYELSQTFFIKDVQDAFTICNVILPNSDQLDQNSNMEHFGVALGFVAHLVSHLSKILLVPLQYPVKLNSSRSAISDHISEEAIIDTIKEFPLYLKGSEKALFLYAVHLLNKNIGQIRQHCGYGGSRSMLKKTLPNLKYLLDELIKDFFELSQPLHQQFLGATPTSAGGSKPIDTYLNSTTENGRHVDLSRMSTRSTLSSQSSSFAMTTGLSLTPPTPSPGVAVDHENFHNVAIPVDGTRQPVANGTGEEVGNGVGVVTALQVGGARQPVANGTGKEVGNGVGVVTEVGNIAGGNGHLGEASFDVGMFRSRSSHVMGEYPRRGSTEGSGGSSSHEQLHREASVDAESGDLQSRMGRGANEQEQSLTPPSFPNQQLERYILEQNTAREQQQQQQQQQQQDDRHRLIHYEQSHGTVRETSPAGAGMFVPSAEEGMSSMIDPLLQTVPSESGDHGNDGVESWNSQSAEEAGPSNRNLLNLDGNSESYSYGRKACLSELSGEYSCLDFPGPVMRSSKLVDANAIQPRRDRAESREHNMEPPDPLTSSPRISFTASGFSRLSPGENEIRASTPTSYLEHGSNQAPQVFVQQPFSPDDSCVVATGDFVSLSDWSVGASMCPSRDSRSPDVLHEVSSSPPPSSKVVAVELDSQPLSLCIRKENEKEVELAEMSTLPLSTYSLKEETTDLTGTDVKKTFLSTSTPSSEGLPSPSTSPTTLADSCPRAQVSYTAFPQSPQLYKSSLATPHVLGSHHDEAGIASQQRVRANSSRVQRSQLKGGGGYNHSSGRSRSHSVEGSPEFLEDFIDGF